MRRDSTSTESRTRGDEQAKGWSESRPDRLPPASTVSSQRVPDGIAAFLRAGWHRGWLLGLLLVVATLVAYQPAWNGKPVWDDEEHLTKPELRSLEGLARIWTQLGEAPQYYPLVHSVFWVEYKLWGDSTLGYHLVNILLHAFSALLLLKILQQLAVPGAWLAAAIFALHPVQVESVAWITELKNTLSGVFYLGSALAYLSFDRTRRMKFYVVALMLFGLGLLSKTVIATLPAALLVVFWWKRGRLSWQRDMRPLAPFFVAGIVAGLFTAWVERKFIGAEGKTFDLTVVERCLIAGRAVWFYLGKLFWPAELVFIYPRWSVNPAVGWQYLFPAAGLVLLAGLWGLRRRWRGPLAGLLFFGGTLFPALGFLNVYPFRYSFVADHYQYLASLGVITATSAGVALWLGRWKLWRRPAGNALCVALLATLAGLTWWQSAMYINSETLWGATLTRNPDCFLAHNNLGNALLRNGQVDEAIMEFQKALDILPDYELAHNNLGNALLRNGRVDEAMAHFEKALEILPDNARVHNNLANALVQKGQTDEAIAHYQKALDLQPDDAQVHNSLGIALMQRGRVDGAMTHFQRALELQPDYAKAHNNLGYALLQQGRVDEALAHFQRALELQPDFAEAHNNLANALVRKGRVREAVAHYQRSLEIRPDNARTLSNLAWVLATSPEASVRNGAGALALAEQAERLTGSRDAMSLRALAAAYAEAGRFAEALATAQRALQLAEAQSNGVLAEALGSQLKFYQAGAPYRDAGPADAPANSSRP